MKRARVRIFAWATAIILASFSAARADTDARIPFDVFGQHLNIVLSVTDADKTNEFYGDILGLKRIVDIDFPGEAFMIRYMGGTTEIKLIVTGEELVKSEGGTRSARGIRMMALLLPATEREGILGRLEERGLPQPQFRRVDASKLEYGFVRDFDDNQIELVFFDEGAPKSTFDRLQIGLTVSDTEAMRAFLRDIMKLSELDAVQIPDGPMKYSFQAGDTTIKFWSFGTDLPAAVGSPFERHGYNLVQFLVKDVETVHEMMVERGATIAAEPFPLGELATIMFVEGPDGILFEFAGPQRKE